MFVHCISIVSEVDKICDKMSGVDLQEVHDFLIEVAYKAGEMITSATPNAAEAGQKKNSVDLVTDTDKAIEEMVSYALREKHPDFEYVESFDFFWIVDLSTNITASWAKKHSNRATN